MNETTINDDGAVYPDKKLARQPRRECCQLLPHQILLGSGVYANIVSGCLKTFNFIQWNKDGATTFFKRQPSTGNG